MRFCVFLVTVTQIFFWGSSSENSFLVCMCTWFFFSVLILLFQIARMLPHNTYFLQYHVPFRHCKNECQERKCSCSFEHLCFYCCNKSQAGRKKEKILLKCNFFLWNWVTSVCVSLLTEWCQGVFETSVKFVSPWNGSFWYHSRVEACILLMLSFHSAVCM